jgi:hypothetical protein
MWTAGWSIFTQYRLCYLGLYSFAVTDEDYGPGEGYDNEIAGISSVFGNGYCETINRVLVLLTLKLRHIQLFMITI